MHETATGGSALLTGLGAAAFYLVCAVTIGSSLAVAFWRNAVYSAFALVGTFLGVAGIYVFLAADFLAVLQLMIYVGGILVLMLFAIMLTSKIAESHRAPRSVGAWAAGSLCAGLLAILVLLAVETPWKVSPAREAEPLTGAIGEALLTRYLLPFEVASVVLLAALVGAVVIARGVRWRREEP